ncbi:MAG: sugar kinase [Candidatus Puniceispirillales bacterium]|jgi:2-dehydro-3-deoxygluconokinase|tara:strand:+ start:789 stop:1724 length:936 start_codon:yes stop_codon:yes gene_type:complete
MYKKAIFLGECMIELNGDISSLENNSSNIKINFGGDTYNSAVYFSRLTNNKTNTFYSTALGKDNFSKKMISRFKNENIKCDYIRTDGENPPGLYSIEINEKGERSFSYWRDQSPSKYIFLGSKGKKLVKDINNADVFYYTGISAGILDEKQRKDLIKIGSTATICGFDFNYRSQLHYNKKVSQLLFNEINNRVDIHFVSFDDARELFKIKNPLEIFEIINEKKNLILIRYKNSIIFKNKQQEIKTVTVPHGEVVDTTAAGDAFNGSFLAIMNNNKNVPVEENILISHSVTREVIKHRGAIISKNKMPKIKT